MNNENQIETLDDLRRAYPELVDQVAQEAAQAERTRIQDIEEMAVLGSEELALEAKFIKPMSAADFAKAAMKRAKAQGEDFLDKVRQDATASGVNKVGQEPGSSGGHDEFMDAIRNQGDQKQ